MALLQHPETEFDVQKLLDRLFTDVPFIPEALPRMFAMPPCDIYEQNGNFFVEFAAPGFDEQNLHVEVSGSTVTISGSFSEIAEKKNAKFYRRQIPRSSFTRTVTLPADIDPQSVEATMHNGLLTLVLRPLKPIVPKKIAIKAA